MKPEKILDALEQVKQYTTEEVIRHENI
jgi:hypothetical protein